MHVLTLMVMTDLLIIFCMPLILIAAALISLMIVAVPAMIFTYKLEKLEKTPAKDKDYEDEDEDEDDYDDEDEDDDDDYDLDDDDDDDVISAHPRRQFWF